MNIAARWLGHLIRDLRFSLRGLAKSPGFTAITAGSLALGIGGSTAMYSVIYGVILNPFAYRDVDRLVSVHVQDSKGRSNGSYYSVALFEEIAARSTVFTGVIASTWSDVTLTGQGDPLRLRGNHCTMNTFDVMGVPPLIGRTTTPEDALPGAEPVAILGYKFWRRQFNGSSSALGSKLTLNGKVRTVVGVMPRRFMWRGADVYLPDAFRRGEQISGVEEVHLLGRLKRGISEAQAAAGLMPIFEDLRRTHPNDIPEKQHLRLLKFKQTFPSDITETLWILFGAVGLLLLISCVNVSSLLLTRMAVRQREIAIRSAIGASRSRLVSQLLSETLVLALLGAATGVVAAYSALRGIIAMVPPDTIPDEAEISLNTPVLWFTFGLSLAAALIAGLAPALQFSGKDVLSSLKELGRGMTGGARQRWLRNALVIGEVALALMLVMGASLMIRTLISIQSTDLGFHRERILTLRIPFSRERYPTTERRNSFLLTVINRIDQIPGVAATGVNSGLSPVGNWTSPVEFAGSEPRDNSPVMMHNVNPGYQRVMGLSVVMGRFLNESDVNGKVHNGVVNQTFVRRFFPAESVLGKTVRLPRLKTGMAKLEDDSFVIAGVVRNSVNRASTRETLPEIYIPYTLAGLADQLYILGKAPPESLDRTVRDQIYATDPGQPVTDVRTLETVLDEYVYARPRFNLVLFGVFAGLGLVLAVVGVHGVISHSVSQRTREIGIRLALGASYRQVTGMVLATAARLLTAGVVIGLVASALSVRVLKGLVQNVSTLDGYSLAGTVAILVMTGLFASYSPARRAARVDPVRALREE